MCVSLACTKSTGTASAAAGVQCLPRHQGPPFLLYLECWQRRKRRTHRRNCQWVPTKALTHVKSIGAAEAPCPLWHEGLPLLEYPKELERGISGIWNQ